MIKNSVIKNFFLKLFIILTRLSVLFMPSLDCVEKERKKLNRGAARNISYRHGYW